MNILTDYELNKMQNLGFNIDKLSEESLYELYIEIKQNGIHPKPIVCSNKVPFSPYSISGDPVRMYKQS